MRSVFRSALALLACLAIACTAAPAGAAAPGVNIAWNGCGAAGVSNRSFACDTNTGSEQLVFSFVPNSADSLYEVHGEIVIGFGGLTTPDWWRFEPTTGCHRNALSASADLGALAGDCADLWGGQAFLFTTRRPSSRYPGFESILVDILLDHALAQPLIPGVEYGLFRLVISHQKTVGAGACAGCAQPLCLAHRGMTWVGNPAQPVTHEYFVGQGSYPTVSWNGNAGCDRVVPARNRTWGAIKSLYD